MEPLGADDAEAGVGIAENQHGIRLHLDHQLVALRDDVAHGLAQVLPHRVHIDIRVGELEVLEKDAVKVVVVVLPRMGQQAVEIGPAFIDDGRETDDFGARADDDEQLELAVVLELCHSYLTGSK